MKKFIYSALLILAVSLSGCKTMEFGGNNWINQTEKPRLRSPLKLGKKSKEDEFGSAQKMAVIWKDTVLQKAGAPSTRGFGGRVYFYDAENKPVKVDGEMIVYGFDQKSASQEADVKYVFKRDKLQNHYNETALGHSYSFWVPWDAVGNPRSSVTLIPIFKSTDGKLVKGGQTINVLPGPAPKESGAKRPATFTGKDAEIQLTSGQVIRDPLDEAAPMFDETSEGMRTTTIKLPKHLASRVSGIPNPDGPFNEVKTAMTNTELGHPPIDLRDQDQVVEESRGNFSPFKAVIEKAMKQDSKAEATSDRKVFGKPAPFGR